MGFRDYSPNLNRFLTRDMYEGALSDLALATDPFTGNRYAFGGGNPIGAVEIDGHCWDWLCDTVGGWLNGAVHATWDPVRDWVATSVGGMAAAGCPAQVGAQGGCTGVQDTVTNDIKQKTDFNVPIGNPNSTTYKVADVVGQITGIPIPGGAAAAADSLAARIAARAGAGKVGTDLVPKAIISLGKWGESRLAQYLGGAGFKPTKPFITSLGPRYVDRLVNGIGHESKAGLNVKLTPKLRKQIEKDAELVATGQLLGAHWHFWQGAQQDILDFLTKHNIPYTLHP
jgi:hypothetical protein